jgi:excisionase family DNA binding protein
MASVEPGVYSLKEAAIRLGMGERRLLKYVQDGFCGAFQMGKKGCWKIPRSRLDRFIENGGQLEPTDATNTARKPRKGVSA